MVFEMRSFLLLTSSFSFCQCDLFVNPFQIQTLFEEFLTLDLKDNPSLEKIQNSFQLEINGNYHESQIMDQLCSNPIHVYQLIKATKSLDWKEVQEVDVLGATNAVVNTQFTYKLPTEDLIVGQIGQRQTHGFLDAPDCLILAKSRISNDYASQYALAIEWAEMALSLDTSSQEIQDFLDEMKDLHDIKFIPSAYEDGQFFIRKFNGTDITTKQLRILEENQFQRKFPSEDWEELRQRNQLCRGEKISNFVGYCEYRTNNDPWLLLSPLKAEILYEKFPLVLFHGLISNTEILILKDLAQKDMKRSSVHSASGNEATFQRIQSSAWLWDPDHDLLQTLSKRLDHALQLSVSKCSEPYQIGVYPPGGYYTHHYDVLEPMLSDTDGGATVFPKLGISIFPTKGSAAFWYNLTKDGKKSMMSLHSACPTIFGIKWVSNKWIREGDQLFKRPCDLTKDEI